jgi:hypothetical protein
VQLPLEFRNFYLRLIRKYAKVTLLLTEPPKKGGSPGRAKCEWTRDVELGFRKVRKVFSKAMIVQHFHWAERIILQTGESQFETAGIPNPYDGCGVLRPVCLYSRKCSPADKNYDTYQVRVSGYRSNRKAVSALTRERQLHVLNSVQG